MKFGVTPLAEAEGAILAHGTRHKTGTFKKGRRLSAEDIEKLQETGIKSVIAARLSTEDVAEDEAARLVSVAACGSGARAQEPFTGRANLYATAKGLLVFDAERLKAINHLHESLTIATLPNHARVEPKQMLATIKVIPFAVPRNVLEKALPIIGSAPLFRVSPFRAHSAALIMTRLPQTKASILAKSEAMMRERLEAMGATLGFVTICEHDSDALRLAIHAAHDKGCSPILLMGASAIVDRADVIPAAVEKAGGEVLHLGMPVDPGNLLMLARLKQTPVVGVPSCARSPKVNGFDWVLERIIADLPVTPSDLMDMGEGGLLAEIPSRPSPRESKNAAPFAPRVVAIVLAAGLSSRMSYNKLLADLGGEPLLAATLRSIKLSAVDGVIVVTGRDAAEVEVIAKQQNATVVHNAHYADGIASSIRRGIAAAAEAEADAALICLGDMPLIKPSTIGSLISAFNPTEHRTIIAPTHGGEFGNPVLWGGEHFARLTSLSGDRGARKLISELKADAVEVAVDDPGILADADTPEALAELRAAKL